MCEKDIPVKNYKHLLKDLKRAEARSSVKLNPDQKLSLCMIVRNEEKYLADALKSVQDVVDEIIVVDTGSTDRTVDIAREYGAKVFFYEWSDDFAAARNESLKHATGDWILQMDADERLDENLKNNIRVFLVDSDRAIRYQVFIRNYMSEGDASSIMGHYMVRLFRKTPDTSFFGVIHEQIYPNTGIITIPAESLFLWHLGYENLAVKSKKVEERNIPLIKKALENAEKLNNMDLYSFYAFYLGSSLTDAKEANKWLKIAIDSYPIPEEAAHIPVAYVDYLRTFYYLQDLEGGVAAAKEALEKFPEMRKYPDFWDFYGILELSLRHPDQAIYCFQEALRFSTSENDQAMFYAARNSKIGGWGTLLNMGMAYAAKQDQAKTEEYIGQAIEAYPGQDKEKLLNEVYNVLGETSLIQKYFEKKLQEEQEINQYDLKNLSNVYLRQEKPFEALMLQTRVHGPEKTIETAFDLGGIYEMSDRRDLALKTYEGILSLEPDNFKALLHKNILGWIEAAVEEFSDSHFEALKQACKQAQDWYLLGEFCLQVGALEPAKQCLDKVLAEEPENYQAQLHLALLAQLQENPEEAETILQGLVEAQPQRAEGLTQLGNLYLASQRFTEAENIFLQLQELNTNANWYIPYALGVALSAQGRLSEAEKALQKSLEFSPQQPEAQQLMELLQTAQAEQTAG
jgi:glycosyltransferase involved in cell wall biosynthesis/cytochrome c-type biogenesis protein CcmH/NrfG